MNRSKMTVIGLFALCSMYLFSCQQHIELDGVGLSIREAVYTSGENYMGFSVQQNASLQVTAVLTPGNETTTEVTFANYHPDVMSVSSTGLVTGLAVGRDTLVVTSTQYPDLSVRYVVNVLAN